MIMNGLSQGGSSDSRVPVIYTTSYVGTGVISNNNPVTITFDFAPQIIIINDGYSSYRGQPIIFTPYSAYSMRIFFDQNNYLYFIPFYCNFNFSTNTLSFYNGSYRYYESSSMYGNGIVSPQFSLNNSGTTYHVLAIGYKEEV